MSDGFPPREQHSERPELAVTRASVCVQKIGWSVTRMCVQIKCPLEPKTNTAWN